MSLNLSIPNHSSDLKPRIVVIGVGGAGGNAVNNMIHSNLEGVECVVANADAQALAQSMCERRIQLGRNITQGLGAGSRPDIGRAAAEESIEDVLEHLHSCHMAFITAGMGGGTGTGAAPVIARAARDQGILTVGVVTKPFHFEGPNRMRLAEEGLDELQQFVDTLIVIPNQNLFRVANEKTTFSDAFKMADDVLYSGVRGVTDLMVMPGLINLDFADIRTVMSEMGKAMMGSGESEGADRARESAEKAIANPLLDDMSMKGSRGVLINITGGPDMTLYEVDEAVNRVRDEIDAGAMLIFGSTFEHSLEGKMRVSIFATGIDAQPVTETASVGGSKPIKIRLVGQDGAVAKTTTATAITRPREPAPRPAPRPAPQMAPAMEEDQSLADLAVPSRDLDPAAAQPEPARRPRAPQPIVAAPTSAPRPRTPEPMIPRSGPVVAEPMPAPAAVAPTPGPAMPGVAATDSAAAQLDLAREVPAEPQQPVSEPAPMPPVESGPPARESASVTPFSAPEPVERSAPPPQEEDDLLEIPAFLRRQAN